ncbi:hypothetical protein AB3Z07_14690 [Metabacillus halosaccharovorans]|uniref:hypothetical protein n=1 Tax=Metabacillus halosaccharovorans TaxID=930124 RepID=UPI00203FAEDA|nr:hypothetical protein [Metabacillus halosaccharovorans]MCM3442188.1 hypothetical protein [Metabacillus halosaccharovorans]
MGGLLNLGSLVLGLVAWILPIVNIVQVKNQNNRKWMTLSVLSISACAISLCFQIFYSYHLVQIEDWSALMDTAGAVAYVGAYLLIVTLLLNGVTLYIYRRRIAK